MTGIQIGILQDWTIRKSTTTAFPESLVWLEAKFAAHLFPLYKVLSSGQKVSEPATCKTLRQMPGFAYVSMSKLKP